MHISKKNTTFARRSVQNEKRQNSKKQNIMAVEMENMCSHLKRTLLEADGVYHAVWQQIAEDDELTAVVRSRQLHIYRNGKKVLILAGKSAPKLLHPDPLEKLLKEIM